MHKTSPVKWALITAFAIAVIMIGSALWAGGGGWPIFDDSKLPPDQKALSYFKEHKEDFTALLTRLEREPSVEYVDRYMFGLLNLPKDSAHRACARLLRGTGARFCNYDHADGFARIVVWGSGCAVCVDYWKGFAFIPVQSSVLKHAIVSSNLEDEAIPHNQRGGFQAGMYIKPIGNDWYMFRHEGS